MRRDGEHWAHYWVRLLDIFSVEITALLVGGLWHEHPVVLGLGVLVSMGAVVYAAAGEGEITGWLIDLMCFLLLNRMSLTILAVAYAGVMAVAGRREK
ncbi:MAG: hypothetical protein WC291_09485 [Thermodesulfovibrionales bacterium]|jgi:hypothetical protein